MNLGEKDTAGEQTADLGGDSSRGASRDRGSHDGRRSGSFSSARPNGTSGYGAAAQDRGGYGDRGGGFQGERNFQDRGFQGERPRAGAMEVLVDSNIEKAMKVLKRKLIKEGLFKELKSRRYYEKPSERKKRKHKESLKKQRKEEARQKKNPYLFS